MKKILVVVLIMCVTVFLVACNDSTITPPETGSQAEPSSSESPSKLESEVASNIEDKERPSNYDEAIALYEEDELVRDNDDSTYLKNVELLESWIDNYQQGIPGEVAVVFSTEGGPSLYVLESNGSATYTITEYRTWAFNGSQLLKTYESSCVVERAYDYVFGADFSADIMRNAIVFHKVPAPEMMEMDWEPQSDSPFDNGITFEEAEERATEMDQRIYSHLTVIPNITGGGVYLRQNIIDQAVDFEWWERRYKVTGAIDAGGRTCYVISGNSDIEALERGESDGNVKAVSIDGNLVFIANEAHGGWIFVDDAEQQIITPNIN